MNKQPEALRLADALEADKWHISGVTAQSAADELRRLHAVNAEFLAVLNLYNLHLSGNLKQDLFELAEFQIKRELRRRAAIAKATGEKE